MIRLSSSPRFDVTRIDDRSPTNAAFLARVAEETTAAERRGALLLVGATDVRALAVRRAQSHLRLDRRPSYWSHAAVLVSWEQEDPGAALGVEVTLDPEDVTRQVPERNGVTPFRLARYLDAARYPNLCVAAIDFAKSPDIKDRICEAALRPNVERARYPFWDQLAAWARHAYAPSTTPNPLLEAVALPGAALCERAFEAGGLDLLPSATGPNGCPELVWATLLYWHDQVRQLGGALRAFCVVRDEVGTPPPALPHHLFDELPAPAPARAARRPRARSR